MIRHIVVLIALAGLFPTSARALTTEALLDSLQHTSFDYFWNEANPANGLIKDRSTPTSPCSIASVGFGLSAICIGIDHGWVTREAGRERILTTLETFWNAPQGSGETGYIGYKGLYYHFLNMNTATRAGTSELSTIDTALLFAGILDAKQYFELSDSLDARVRALADSITQRADWEFTRNSGVGIMMGWKPITGFLGYGTWIGYNEAMIMYILALGSPTHPVNSATWFTWVSGYNSNWATHYGYTYLTFPPLFGHQYSHCWIDYRDIQDAFMRSKGITYFENSRLATYAQRAYCVDNPIGWTGYGENLWGLTASDDPYGYGAHGAPPPQNDNGTITPTAAASSIAFAPEIVIPVLHNMYDTYQAELWSTYGFKDAFNLTLGWWDTDYLGIDQGPIIIMIENYLNGSVWSRFMQNPDVQAGLQIAGFLPVPVTGVGDDPGTTDRRTLLQNAPNPFRSSSIISYTIDAPGHVSLILFDVQGRPVKTLVDDSQAAGPHHVRLEGQGLPSGAYFYKLIADGKRERRRCTVLR